MILEFQFTFYLHSNFEYHHMVKNDAFTLLLSTDSNQVLSPERVRTTIWLKKCTFNEAIATIK